MKTIAGYLTPTEKKAIKAILNSGKMDGKVGKKNYILYEVKGVYTVKIVVQDRGLIPVPGSILRWSTYTHEFTL